MRAPPITTLALYALLAGLSAPLAAQTPAAPTPMAPKAVHPCDQIKAACKSAGFIAGDFKTGNGLWVDCVDPIIQGKPQPPKAKIPLPQVSAQVVTACRQAHPNFGEPKKSKSP